MLATFSKILILQDAFEIIAHINEELTRTKFDGALCKKFKLIVDIFFFIVSLNVETRYENDVPYLCSFYYFVISCMTGPINLRAQ